MGDQTSRRRRGEAASSRLHPARVLWRARPRLPCGFIGHLQVRGWLCSCTKTDDVCAGRTNFLQPSLSLSALAASRRKSPPRRWLLHAASLRKVLRAQQPPKPLDDRLASRSRQGSSNREQRPARASVGPARLLAVLDLPSSRCRRRQLRTPTTLPPNSASTTRSSTLRSRRREDDLALPSSARACGASLVKSRRRALASSAAAHSRRRQAKEYSSARRRSGIRGQSLTPFWRCVSFAALSSNQAHLRAGPRRHFRNSHRPRPSARPRSPCRHFRRHEAARPVGSHDDHLRSHALDRRSDPFAWTGRNAGINQLALVFRGFTSSFGSELGRAFSSEFGRRKRRRRRGRRSPSSRRSGTASVKVPRIPQRSSESSWIAATAWCFLAEASQFRVLCWSYQVQCVFSLFPLCDVLG